MIKFLIETSSEINVLLGLVSTQGLKETIWLRSQIFFQKMNRVDFDMTLPIKTKIERPIKRN